MISSCAKTWFPKEYGKVEKKRQEALARPLSMQEINTLLSMRHNNEPLYEGIEAFHSDEYLKAVEDGKNSAELEKLQRFRPATAKEANLLYSDIHARDEKTEYTGGGAQSE